MAYKDKGKYTEYLKQTYMNLCIRIRKDDAIYPALFKMQDVAGTPLATYAILALRNQLIADGYMKE